MIDLVLLDEWRVHIPGFIEDSRNGMFSVPSKIDRQALKVIACAHGNWDHVSVSRKNRCPNWEEMEQIKRLFFHDHEVAMQLHVPPDDHISYHPYCLHIWRPQHLTIPLPPAIMVGPKTKEEAVKLEKEFWRG